MRTQLLAILFVLLFISCEVDPLEETSDKTLERDSLSKMMAPHTLKDGQHWVETADGTIYWDENATSQGTTKPGEKYLGEAVILFNGSVNEKLGTGNNLFGENANLAKAKVYGPSGTNDIKNYDGFTMGSDNKKFGAIADGTYQFNYDDRGKSGKLQSHWAVENRGNIPALNGYNPNPNASTNREFKNGIFIHTSNKNGFAGTYNNGKNGISEGCLLIVPSIYDTKGISINNGWDQFNQQLQGVKEGTLQVIRK